MVAVSGSILVCDLVYVVATVTGLVDSSKTHAYAPKGQTKLDLAPPLLR